MAELLVVWGLRSHFLHRNAVELKLSRKRNRDTSLEPVSSPSAPQVRGQLLLNFRVLLLSVYLVPLTLNLNFRNTIFDLFPLVGPFNVVPSIPSHGIPTFLLLCVRVLTVLHGPPTRTPILPFVSEKIQEFQRKRTGGDSTQPLKKMLSMQTMLSRDPHRALIPYPLP